MKVFKLANDLKKKVLALITEDDLDSALQEKVNLVGDGDKGDITVSGLGTIWTIEDNSVTQNKLNATGAGAGKVLQTDGTVMFWQTLSPTGTDILQTITMSANATYNKSDLTGNILFLSTNDTTTRTFTVGTGFVANDKLTFVINARSLGLINISINSKSISNNRGAILSFIFNGTNWINTNVYGWDLSTDNLFDAIFGFNNQSRAGTQNIITFGYGNTNNGESVVIGTSNVATSQNNDLIIGKNNSSAGDNAQVIGNNNQNNSGAFTTIYGQDNRNNNSKQYVKCTGRGVRILHTGEIVNKIDNKSYSATALQSHLRIVNFGVTTTNATQTEIYLNDSTSADRLILSAKSSYAVKGRMVAFQSDYSDTKHWEFDCLVKRDDTSTTLLISPLNQVVLQESAGASTWDIVINADDIYDSIKLEVIGQTGQTIYWKGIMEIIDLMIP